MKLWAVGAFDPTGRFTDTTGHTFPFRWMAERHRRRYIREDDPFLVPYEGKQVPLVNYKVMPAALAKMSVRGERLDL